MQSMNLTRLLLAGLFSSCSLVNGAEIEDVVKLSVEISNSLQNNTRELEGIKSTIASLSTRLDNITQELKGTLGLMDVKHDGFQWNIMSDLVQRIESLLNLTVANVRNETLPHDKEWIIIQRRGTPLKPGKARQDFNRPWVEYAEGFGDYDADFWIGLDTMHQLTSAGYTQLRFDLEDWEGNTAYAQYSVFRISSATDKYRITFGGYSGNAGDSPVYNNQQEFSTSDRDNDGHSSMNCAQERGPWWHPKCSYVHLNNIYHNQSKVSGGTGIHWYDWKGYEYSLKKT